MGSGGGLDDGLAESEIRACVRRERRRVTYGLGRLLVTVAEDFLVYLVDEIHRLSKERDWGTFGSPLHDQRSISVAVHECIADELRAHIRESRLVTIPGEGRAALARADALIEKYGPLADEDDG